MDAKAASLRQKRQRFQCGRGCGKGQLIYQIRRKLGLEHPSRARALGLAEPAGI